MKLSQSCKCTSSISFHTLGFNMLSCIKIIYDIRFYYIIYRERAESYWHTHNFIGCVSGQFFYYTISDHGDGILNCLSENYNFFYDLSSKVDRFSQQFWLTVDNIDSDESYYSNASNYCKIKANIFHVPSLILSWIWKNLQMVSTSICLLYTKDTLLCRLPSIFRATFQPNSLKRSSDEEEGRRIFIKQRLKTLRQHFYFSS